MLPLGQAPVVSLGNRVCPGKSGRIGLPKVTANKTNADIKKLTGMDANRDTHPMYVAILAGGVGTRLWPRSRQAQPKQFSDIQGGGRTMIQTTVDRLAGLVKPERIYVITGARYVELAQSQLPTVPAAQILAEPCGRNTAPALGLSCLYLRRRDPNAVLVALPSDHVIKDRSAFQSALQTAAALAHTEDYLVTLGIEPTAPHTGYGYIQREERPLGGREQRGYPVQRFLEKPPQGTAEAFLQAGGYYWNAGMFICRAQHMLNEMARQMPQLYAGLLEIDQALNDSPNRAQAVIDRVWPMLPNISIDHGIMEGAARVAVVPLAAGWNDVGSWDALDAVLPHDAARNVAAGGDMVTLDSYDNIVYAAGKKIVALIGVDNLVVVDTGDAILVGQKQQMQRVKEIVDSLKKTGRSRHL